MSYLKYILKVEESIMHQKQSKTQVDQICDIIRIRYWMFSLFLISGQNLYIVKAVY